MLSRPKKIVIVFIGLFALFNSSIHTNAQNSTPWLVSPKLLEHANLRVRWQIKLPIRERDEIERLTILDDRVYALSDRNFMVCLNRENGEIVFSKQIAPAGFTILGLDLYDGMLISIIGNKLFEIDLQLATERRVKALEFGVTCPAARNSLYYYFAGVDGRLRVFRADNFVHVFEVAPENESMITSVIANETSVIFGTDRGNVISFVPDLPKKLWQFDARAAVAGSIIEDGGSLFFASKDTNVYRLDVYDQRWPQLTWKFQAESVLDRAPRVTPNVVYQYAFGKSLTAINRESGMSIWSLPGGLDLLAEAAGKAYVITDKRTLTVMDNYSGKKLYWVNFAAVTRHAVNTVDSKIYVADDKGLVACLESAE